MVEYSFGTNKRAINAGYTLLKEKQKVKEEFGVINFPLPLKSIR